MADVFDLYVKDNRTIQFKFTEPIMLEDSRVTDWVFHIPRILNNLDVSGWAWWLVYINARGQKYSELLELSEDPESPLEKCIATYSVDYGMSIRAGVVRFSLEAINTDTGGEILNEWHTQTYQAKVQDTLQGNQVEFAETESDIISALIIEVQNKVAQLVGGATPEPVSLIADMTDTKKVYLYVGSETGESTNYWYYHNGSAWVAGGLYASGITVDAVPTQDSSNAVSSGAVWQLNEQLIDEINRTYTKPYEPTFNVNTGGISVTGGNYDNHPERARTQYISVESGKTYLVHLNTTDYAFHQPWLYSTNAYATATRRINLLDDQNLIFTADENENYFRVGFKNSVDDTLEITEENRTTIHDALAIYTEKIDAVPIQGSTNAVSSGGVYDEIETVSSEIDKTNARIIDEIGRIYTNPYEPTFSVNTGGITPAGANYDNHPERARTSYVFIEPGKTYFVHLNTTDYVFYRPWLYSRNAYASATRMVELLDNQNLIFTATESENYFRVGFKNSIDDTQEITEGNRTTIHDSLAFYSVKDINKAIRTGEFIRFTVKVNNTWSHTTETDTADHESGGEHDHLCILTLPESYTTNGTKTPLIMYCHGASCGITNSSWYGNGTGEGTAGNFLSMVRTFTAQGYAIFDVNNTRQVSSGFNDWGCLPLMSAYIKAWEYVKEKYNVSDKLYLLSASMGTPVALNMMKWYKGDILASLILAPRPMGIKGRWDDTYGEITDARKKEFLVAWGFEPDSILEDSTYVVPSKESVFTAEVDAKLKGFYHYENMVTINGTDYIFEKFPPTKVMVGTNDTGFLAEVREYFSALQNFGNYINYREVVGQSHGAMCTLVNGDLRSEGLAWFERFRYVEQSED